jgi:hypothetical protein
MRTVLKISTVLSWVNLIIGGFFTVCALYAILAARNLSLLISAFLLSSIILHSYAALQLRRSIVDPTKPLSSQTPTGIRFVGAVALFFGMLYFASGIAILQNAADFLKLMQAELTQPLHVPLADIRVGGFFVLLCGLSIALNVILNFRLLRWYYLMKGMM